MNRALTAVTVAALLMVSVTGARARTITYGWTISASSIDPYVQAAQFVPGLNTFHVWLACCDEPVEGMSAAEFGIVSDPANPVVEFLPMNGFLNAGTPTNLLLAVGGCPCGPVIAGTIRVFVSTPGSLCIESSTNGVLATADCEAQPNLHPMNRRGVSFGGELCGDLFVCTPPLDAPGACCLPDGSCQMTNPIDHACEKLGGVFYGSGVPCQYVDCPEATSVDDSSWGRVKARYRGGDVSGKGP